jgi:hypothetical protein
MLFGDFAAVARAHSTQSAAVAAVLATIVEAQQPD